MIKVSVVMPTYGEPLFLRKAINSVLNQSLQELELIVVDDNNPKTKARDLTEKLVQEFEGIDTRVKYVKHEYNRNGAVARNTGFAMAQGKYISLLDSDDEYMPERLKKCYEVMEKAPKTVAGVYTGCEFKRKGVTYHEYKSVKGGNFLVETLACRFGFCTGSNIFVRKEVVDELNGFDEEFLRHQDYEFLVRVFERYSLIAIPELLVIKNNECLNVPNLEKQVAIKKQYLEKFKYIIDKLPQKDVNYIMHGNYINIAENAMGQGKSKIANEYYKKAGFYGGLTLNEWVKRLLYPIRNIIK